MEEIWKDIEGYEGLYQVSNLGRVKSLGNGKSNNSKERIKKQTNTNTRGYLQVQLSKDGSKKMFLVHRLVASAFIPNPNDLETVNHKDENKENNSVKNLEWMTNKDNKTYSSGKSIKCLDIKTNETTYFSSINEAARQLNLYPATIHRSIYKSKSPYKKRFIFSEDK